MIIDCDLRSSLYSDTCLLNYLLPPIPQVHLVGIDVLLAVSWSKLKTRYEHEFGLSFFFCSVLTNLFHYFVQSTTIRTVSKTSNPKLHYSFTTLHQVITYFNSGDTILPHWWINRNKAIVTKCYQDFSQWDVESVSSMFKLREEEQQKGLM